MSKKVAITDPFQPKITRNDRFAQMSHQEKVIEQKKREIQAKLEAKQKTTTEATPAKAASPTPPPPKPVKKITLKKPEIKPKNSIFNHFSNDGSFLNTFKQLKDKKADAKLKFKPKDGYHENRGANAKNSRWSQRRRSPSPKKPRISRFSDKTATFEPKITINTSFTSNQQCYESPQLPISPQNATGQPLLKNLPPPSVVVFSNPNNTPVIAAPPLLLNVPPPQLVSNQTTSALLIPSSTGSLLVSAPSVNVTLPASGVLTTVELSSIPPPNPIQVQNIPQPEPLNALNIPHPAPIQVQNIPTPQSIQLNEIPAPKPLDLMQIPTPNEDKMVGDPPDFIKNIPPPNKSVPPPPVRNCEPNMGVPPPGVGMISVSVPPPIQGVQVQSLGGHQTGILLHTLPPPPQMQGVPPPGMQQAAFTQVSSISVVSVNNAIPSLMAQPILPPPGVVNVSCPPPMLPSLNAQTVQMHQGMPPPPPSFVNQPPPPMTNQMPPMNVPPPQTGLSLMNMHGGGGAVPIGPPFREINAVFPPGTPDYEAMASLGRMVAQCGQGIEDVVKQRKTQDPNLWFLFHKESAAYQQYQQLIEQFRREIQQEKQIESNDAHYKPEDIYEPEMCTDDDDNCMNLPKEIKRENVNLEEMSNKRKRKSRWGDKEAHIQPPPGPSSMPNMSGVLIQPPPLLHQPNQSTSGLMLSKLTRTDTGLLQYTMNTFGTTNLTEDEWKKAEDHYKINLLYQDMVKKREELEKMQQAGRNKYDYDSDEDVDGGTWEHKLRDKEMMATQLWALELNRQAEGKHHIGDFLPPDELKRFMEKSNASKEGRVPNFSDYKEFKIKEDNIGFKMLQKLGWSQGQGLGSNGAGIVEPVNKAASRDHNQGLGLGDEEGDKEDEYEAYRKRMMLAYRFRPNPLNNPRRPYY